MERPSVRGWGIVAVALGLALAGPAAENQPAAGVLKGRVLLPDGTAAPQAQVWILQATMEDGQVSIRTHAELRTGADGSFQAEAPPASGTGQVFLMAAARLAPHALAWRTIAPVGSAAADPLDLRLGQPAPVTGTVSDTAGTPVAGARVQVALLLSKQDNREDVLASDGAVASLRTVTDGQGRFALDLLPQGARMLLHAEADGHGEAWLPGARVEQPDLLLPVGGDPIRVTLGREARLAGTVRRDAGGPGVAGATVLLSLGPQGVLWRRATSGPDGTFAFAGLADGIPYQLRVTDLGPGRKGGAGPVTVTLAAGEFRTAVDLVPAAAAEVRLRLLSEAGDPVAGARVSLTEAASQQGRSEAANDQGELVLTLPPGDWRVSHVMFPGGHHNPPETFRVEAGQATLREIRIPGFRTCTGVVRDEAGKPAAGATVTLFAAGAQPATAKVGDDGGFRCSLFEFEYNRGQPATLVAQDLVRGLVNVAPAPVRGARAEIVLRPGFTLAATFGPGAGKPSPAARVSVAAPFDGGAAQVRSEAVAVGAGRFELSGLPLGTACTVTLEAEGYGPLSRQVEAQPAAGTVQLPDLALVPANLAVAGVVREADGTAVAGAEVQAAGEGQPYRRTQADAQGRFRLEGLCAGPVRLTANVWQEARRAVSLDVTAGATDAVLAFKAVAKITGVVRDDAGQPVAGAQVARQPYQGGRPVTTDTDGRYSLPRGEEPPTGTDGSMAVFASHRDRGLAALVELPPRQSQADVVLRPTVAVAVRVVDEAGAPVAGAGVALLTRGCWWTSSLPDWPGVAADADGRATLKSVPVGSKLVVQANRDGFAPVQLERVFEPAAAAPAALPDLVLRRADRQLRGTVVDAAGDPVVGAQVQIYGASQPNRQTRSDETGHFALEGLCSDRAPVHVWFNNSGVYADLTAELDPTAGEATLKLDKLRTVTGRVVAPDGAAAAGVKVRLPPTAAEAVTGPDGSYRLRWSTNQFGSRTPALWVLAGDEGRDLAGLAAVQPGTACEVALAPALTVRGRVADDTGQPVANASVRLDLRLQPDSEASVISARTGADGTYALRAVPTGYAAAVVVTGEVHGPARATLPDADAGPEAVVQVPTLTVRRATLTVAGKVVNEEGEPAAAANVQLRGDGQPFQGLSADAEGGFRFAHACPGPVTVDAYTYGGTFRRGTVEGQGGDQDLRIEVEPQGNQGVPPVPPVALPVLGQDFDPAKAFYWRDFESQEFPAEWSPAEGMDLEVGGAKRRLLGRFSGDTAVVLNLTGLPAHGCVRLYFELYCFLSWDGDHPGFGPDLMDIRLLDGPRLVFASFANWEHAQSYPMPFRLGSVGPGGGGTPFELAATIVDGKPWSRHALYPMCVVVPHTGDTLRLGFAGIRLGGMEDECWALDNVGVQLLDAPPAADVSAADLAQAWDDLGQRDIAKAWPAMARLAQAGGKGAELLLAKLGWADDPGLRANVGAIATAFLTDDRLTWQDALAECAKLPVRAQPLLARHLDARRFGPDLPSARLAEALKVLWPKDIRDRSRLREARAVFLLERAWTPAARQALFLDTPAAPP